MRLDQQRIIIEVILHQPIVASLLISIANVAVSSFDQVVLSDREDETDEA